MLQTKFSPSLHPQPQSCLVNQRIFTSMSLDLCHSDEEEIGGETTPFREEESYLPTFYLFFNINLLAKSGMG